MVETNDKSWNEMQGSLKIFKITNDRNMSNFRNIFQMVKKHNLLSIEEMKMSAEYH